MPLSQSRLGSAIATAIRNSRPRDGVAVSDADLEILWQRVAREIVNEIKNNAVVTTTVQTVVSTPTDGPDSGSGEGTGTGTIS